MNIRNIMLAVAITIFLMACGSNKVAPPKVEAPVKIKLPSWVGVPFVENGLADAQCVDNTGSMSILKSKATALARAEIARQIGIQVKAMDKTFQNLTDTTEGSTSGSTFEAVSKGVTQQRLSGTRAVKVEYIDFPDNTQKLCVMVTMESKLAEELYEAIVKSSGRQLSAKNNAVLYQKFLAAQAEKQMEEELEKSHN